jgi:uncharacterized protein (DUF608 family)
MPVKLLLFRVKGLQMSMNRRNFVKGSVMSAAAAAAVATSISSGVTGCAPGAGRKLAAGSKKAGARDFNGVYTGDFLNRVAFPLGGIGAGMICLEGTGALSHFSLRNQPERLNEPCTFSAICIKGDKNIARVLEAQVPAWKVFGPEESGNGLGDKSFGLPRFAGATFQTRFPFSTVELEDKKVPLKVSITGWSPFVPGDADNSSLPVAALEYTFSNPTGKALEAVYSFNTKNFMTFGSRKHMRTGPQGSEVRGTKGGFILWQAGTEEKPWGQGAFCAAVDDKAAKVDCRWFRGGWWDPLTVAWKNIEEGAVVENPAYTEGGSSPGGSLYVPFKLGPGQEKTIRLMLSWHVPETELRTGPEVKCEDSEKGEACCPSQYHKPWYSEKYAGIESVAKYWRDNFDDLRAKSAGFSDCFYDTDLPPEVVEAIAANLTILKSPTVMRTTSGKLWCWEGCSDNSGCCHGSCTHVWNYAQAIPHLFPDLERSLRHTEFFVSQDKRGHQGFRSSLPIRPTGHDFHAAADGQLGGIMKAHREWRISGDNGWLRKFWPKVKLSLDYCIETWDPKHKGILEEPHHNTYDIEFWGPDGMCTSFYLGALKAAIRMGEALGEDVSFYSSLYEKGRKYMEAELYDGEYFIQKIQWKGLRAKDPLEEAKKTWSGDYSEEAIELLLKEGPKYQYGTGCISDGVLGAWLASVCGVGEIVDPQKIIGHLLAVHKYNFREDLSEHANPQRPSYAINNEAGLLLCTWPKGGALTLPFVYSDEVWTGIEYQVAAHLMTMGEVEEALEIVRGARARYDGRVRNPFNEYECGNWYARAMASYGMLQGLSGARYDALEKVLYLEPSIKGDFKSFICTATGFGTVGVKGGKPFLEVKQGRIELEKIEYTPQA